MHNYGLDMVVWLYDKKRRYIDTHVKGWYGQYKKLAKAASVFLWGEPFDDSDHFEYHPNWKKPAGGDLLKKVRDWAMRAALANGQTVQYDALATEARRGRSDAQYDFIPENDILWLPYFWWAAGAKGVDSPSPTYLAANQPPRQA